MPNESQLPPRPAPDRSSIGQPFIDPNWKAPVEANSAIASIPKDAQVAGMFFLALQAKAKQSNIPFPTPRERYVAFNFYPLAELVPLMLVAATQFYPGKSVREGLRTLGRGVPGALIASTVGKVVFGSTEGLQAAVEAMAKTYPINLRPNSKALVLDTAANWLIVRLERVPYFLDSHHVGIFEGAMLYAGVQGNVQIAAKGSSSAELLLTW